MTLQLDNQFKRQYNLLQFIRTHQSKNLTLSDLSQKLGISKPTLQKRYRYYQSFLTYD